jgi:hypothetical protein
VERTATLSCTNNFRQVPIDNFSLSTSCYYRSFYKEKKYRKRGKEEDEAYVVVRRGFGHVVSRARHKYITLAYCNPEKPALLVNKNV